MTASTIESPSGELKERNLQLVFPFEITKRRQNTNLCLISREVSFHSTTWFFTLSLFDLCNFYQNGPLCDEMRTRRKVTENVKNVQSRREIRPVKSDCKILL